MIGQRLKEQRLKNNLTQMQIANTLNISQQAYSFYEHDKRTPDYEVLQKLAQLFGVSTSYLFGEDNPVVETGEESLKLSSEHIRLIAGYDDLDEDGQMKVFEYIEFLKLKNGKK